MQDYPTSKQDNEVSGKRLWQAEVQTEGIKYSENWEKNKTWQERRPTEMKQNCERIL